MDEDPAAAPSSPPTMETDMLSPPGMRLRSGKKKRRRSDDDDDDSRDAGTTTMESGEEQRKGKRLHAIDEEGYGKDDTNGKVPAVDESEGTTNGGEKKKDVKDVAKGEENVSIAAVVEEPVPTVPVEVKTPGKFLTSSKKGGFVPVAKHSTANSATFLATSLSASGSYAALSAPKFSGANRLSKDAMRVSRPSTLEDSSKVTDERKAAEEESVEKEKDVNTSDDLVLQERIGDINNFNLVTLALLLFYILSSLWTIPSVTDLLMSLYGLNPNEEITDVSDAPRPVVIRPEPTVIPYEGPSYDDMLEEKRTHFREEVQRRKSQEIAIKKASIAEQAQIISEATKRYRYKEGEKGSDSLTSSIDEIEEIFDASADIADAWSEKVVELNNLWSSDEHLELSDLTESINGFMKDSLVFVSHGIDAEFIHIPGESCSIDEEPVIEPEEVEKLTAESVENHSSKLIERAQKTKVALAKSDEKFADAILDMVSDKLSPLITTGEAELEKLTEELSTEETSKDFEADKARIKQEIIQVLNVDRADRTGVKDFASINAGASIIRDGRYKTSPSVKDMLSVWHRFLAFAKLRFYGYPAEAALSPTYPRGSLGQCWAFPQDTTREMNSFDTHSDFIGSMASLIVRLSEPVKVGSVVIEHPPQGVTSDISTAIRDFRVIGFSDDDFVNRWDLGKFYYDAGKGNKFIKEFNSVFFLTNILFRKRRIHARICRYKVRK